MLALLRRIISSNAVFRKIYKNDCRINKEILKIRNGLHFVNQRNQIMIKNIKFSSIRIKNNVLLRDLKIFNEDTDKCLHDIQHDLNNLVLQNNNQFKVHNKHLHEKIKSDTKKIKGNNLCSTSNIDKSTAEHVEDSIEHTIKVECTVRDEFKKQNDIKCDEKNNTSVTKLENYGTLLNSNSNIFDTQVNDLQTLLIMMAITKPNLDDEQNIPSPDLKNAVVSPKQDQTNTEKANYIMPAEGDVTGTLSIIQLKPLINEKEKEISKKFIQKWKNYVNNRKRNINKQRKEAINNFFDKLAKKKMDVQNPDDCSNKAKKLGRDFETYQHRLNKYKLQKHIIALQKAKLDEQNRIIEELKYNKIIEGSRQSVDDLKDEVIKTYYEIDRQLKPKMKCLTNELKLHDIEEPSLVLHCLKVPKFLQRMEKRAREREEKHALIRERRRQMEEERIRLKQQAEIAKAEMDKEEKLQRIKDLREKRKREKIINIRRKQHVERLRALIVMADLHYERTLTLKYGIRPFRKLIQIKRDNIEKAKVHYAFQLKKNIFLNWMWYTEDMWIERIYIAKNHNRKKILGRAFHGLKLNLQNYTKRKQVAEDFYDLYVAHHIFRHFRKGINIVKKENEIKWQMAVKYHNRTLPALNALKREQEARKARWREKVLLVVPDYIPPDD